MARPRKEIDAEQVVRLAAAGCTVEEMAAILDVHKRTLERRFTDAIDKGRQRGMGSLRHKQFQQAMRGDRVMLIWLGKQMLGQRDRLEYDFVTLPEVRRLIVSFWEAVEARVRDEEVREAIRADWRSLNVVLGRTPAAG